MENNKLLEWNNTQTDYPPNKTIHQLFEEQVEKTPNNIALIYKEQFYTYTQLNEKTNQLAYYLLKENKNTKYVAIYLERSFDMIVAMLATLKLGYTYIAIDANYPQDRINYILRELKKLDLNSCIITNLCQQKLKKKILTFLSLYPTEEQYLFKNKILNIEERSLFSVNPSTNLNLNFPSEILTYIIFTSGSTGQPKGVKVTQQNFLSSFFARKKY